MRAIHVWLVHGTFEPNASWIDEAQSSLCAKLRTELGPDTLFHPFRWSGRNRHADRMQGGENLRGEILAFKELNPETTVHIVGHSHGGALITHALRDTPELSAVVDSVVFLSTPFIQLVPRVQAVAIGAMLAFFALLLLFGVYWALDSGVFNVDNLLSWAGITAWPPWLKSGALIIGLVSYFVFLHRFDKSKWAKWKYERWVRDYLGKVQKEFNIENLNPRNTLFVRAQADEASMLLTFVHGLSRLLGEIVGRVAVAFTTVVPLLMFRRKQGLPAARSQARRIENLVVVALLVTIILVAAFGLLYAAANLALTLFGTSMEVQFYKEMRTRSALLSQAISNVDSLQPTMAIFIMMAGAAGLSLMFLLALLFGMLGRAFGRWFFLPGLFLEVSVEPTPPGRWTVHQLSAPNQSDAFVEGHSVYLTHSLSHSDPRAHTVVAQWIRSKSAFRDQNKMCSSISSPGPVGGT